MGVFIILFACFLISFHCGFGQRRVQIRELHSELAALAVKTLRETTLSGQKDRKKESLGAKEYVEGPFPSFLTWL